MSNSDYDSDMDRYFNDPNYRRKKAQSKNGDNNNSSSSENNGISKKLLRWAGVAAGIIVLVVTGFTIYLAQGLPSIDQLENPQTAVASELKSRDGVVLDRYYTENRTHVPIEKISPHVVDALIATEDHRF